MVRKTLTLQTLLFALFVLLYSPLNAQDPINCADCSTNSGLGQYETAGGTQSNLLVTDPSSHNLNTPNSNTLQNNLIGGLNNTLEDGSNTDAKRNLIFGRNNQIKATSNSVALGLNNSISNGSFNSLAFGEDNSITTGITSTALGLDVKVNGDDAHGYGRLIDITHDQTIVLGYGNPSNSTNLQSFGNETISLGLIARNVFNILLNDNQEPVTGIGTTTPGTDKLRIVGNGIGTNAALNVQNSNNVNRLKVRNDGWTGFSADPSAPYYFTKTNKSPTGFSGGEGKANIVQDLGGFPFINPGNKWISVGERPPDNNDNQIAYGYAATWDNFAGNFFMDDVDQDGTKDLTISFQDAGVTDPGNASNRMRFIARDGDKIFQSGAFNELMSLYPDGQTAIGDFSPSTGKNPEARLHIDVENTNNSDTSLLITDGNQDETFIVKNNGFVGIGRTEPNVAGRLISTSEDDPEKPNSGSWSGFSDKRLKKDIEKYKAGLKEILKVDPIWFKFNGKMGLPTKERKIGVIAQKIKEIAPYMVEKGKNGYYSFNKTAFTYMLINAVQEQQKQIKKGQIKNDSLRQALKDQQEQLSNQQQQINNQQEQLNQLRERLDRLAKQNEGSANQFKKSEKEELNEKTVSIGESGQQQAMLLQNRPNPYKSETTIPYFLPDQFQSASLVINSTNGRLIKRIKLKKPGKGEVTLQTENLNQGSYVYSLIVNGRKQASRKMIKE